MTDDTSEAQQAVAVLLRYMGRDPATDEGVAETPGRVVRAYGEMTRGYRDDPAVILGKTFDVTSDELVVSRGIDFVSLCEHHLLPFTGTVTVGYVPDRRVVGLSKLARLVDCYARRLQIQERMTQEIAGSLRDHTHAHSVAVIVEAGHACQSCRGVQKAHARMVTSCLLGDIRDNPAQRAEFLALHRSDR